MDDAQRKRLAEEWKRNEHDLERLADLPTGDADPARREGLIDQRQDQIEGELGEDWLRRRRRELDGGDPA